MRVGQNCWTDFLAREKIVGNFFQKIVEGGAVIAGKVEVKREKKLNLKKKKTSRPGWGCLK